MNANDPRKWSASARVLSEPPLTSFLSVLAKHLLEAVADLAGHSQLNRHQRFVDQLAKQLRQGLRSWGRNASHRLRRIKGPAAHKNRQLVQEEFLRLRQQHVTPVDRRAQALMAG